VGEILREPIGTFEGISVDGKIVGYEVNGYFEGMKVDGEIGKSVGDNEVGVSVKTLGEFVGVKVDVGLEGEIVGTLDMG